MGLLEVAFIVLLVLKLTGLATISWLVVFIPLIISLIIYILLFIGFVAFGKRNHVC